MTCGIHTIGYKGTVGRVPVLYHCRKVARQRARMTYFLCTTLNNAEFEYSWRRDLTSNPMCADGYSEPEKKTSRE